MYLNIKFRGYSRYSRRYLDL